MPRPTSVDINLAALRHNARLAQTLAGQKRVMAAVKANAYGHGMVRCAHALAPMVSAFAVASPEELSILREADIDIPVLVLGGPFDYDDISLFHLLQGWSVVHSLEQVALLERWHARSQKPPLQLVWLKVDTGMHRLGVDPTDINEAINRLAGINIHNVTLISHLALAEQPDDPLTQRQLRRWQDALDTFDGPTSLMNSAGIINQLTGPSDWSRPGYMLYGGKSSANFESIPLLPVMSVRSAVMAVRSVAAGESVGYGGRWLADRDSIIATVPIGYGDGYPRTAENGTPVWIDGVLCPLVGRVSMDMITVDVTDHPCTTVGSPVQLWGPELSVDTVASHAQTIGYELLTRMPNRLPRRYTQTELAHSAFDAP